MDLYKKNNYKFELDAVIPFKSLVNLKQLIFEVTTACNLKCEYCGYGNLYNSRRIIPSEMMDFSIAKNIIDYLFSLWNENNHEYNRKKTFIGFYGGEPLLNIVLIRKIVDYIESLPLPPRRYFCYTMTTNAMLLDKHMDYLVEKQFKILISLDGNEYSHSYRVSHDGSNSFRKVFSNIKLLQAKYPEYFLDNVTFNSVLTNRGDVFSIKKFIYESFGKYPTISEINSFGVLPEKKELFNKMSRSFSNDWNNSENKEIDRLFLNESPNVKQIFRLIKYLSGNSFGSYNSLLSTTKRNLLPTGTCLPFDRKLFVTADGDLLPCERIPQKFKLGSVSSDSVNIDFAEISKKYTLYYKRVWGGQCTTCFMKPICEQCLFYIDSLDDKPNCPNYKNKNEYDFYVSYYLSFLSKNPDLYQIMMKELF